MLDEQVDVVRHHFERHDLPPPFVDLGPDQLVHTCRDPSAEDRTAVLRAPHHVQPEFVHATGKPANHPGHSHTANMHTAPIYHVLVP
ncbi:hypothetical protein GCM10011579_093100 [Streptomyces albiflavescens]|uniref:Uncharacterized protein n=1 Tax=Streptomyces albiflavescens TaxID=1623582 RepID=A0A917YFB2_9ACTN|nr:hypothetical protein GCM10011579_093100 [Streptomyces albiflavescens]